MTAVLEPIHDEIVAFTPIDVEDDVIDERNEAIVRTFSARLIAFDVETVEQPERVRTITGRRGAAIEFNVSQAVADFERVFEGFAAAAQTASEGLRAVRRRMLARAYGDPGVAADGDPLDKLNAEAVERGVEFLDEKIGRDTWLPRMDTATLDVASSFNCALAQAAGVNYCTAVDWHDVSNPTTLGFSTPYSYSELTEAWRRKIVELRKEAA